MNKMTCTFVASLLLAASAMPIFDEQKREEDRIRASPALNAYLAKHTVVNPYTIHGCQDCYIGSIKPAPRDGAEGPEYIVDIVTTIGGSTYRKVTKQSVEVVYGPEMIFPPIFGLRFGKGPLDGTCEPPMAGKNAANVGALAPKYERQAEEKRIRNSPHHKAIMEQQSRHITYIMGVGEKAGQEDMPFDSYRVFCVPNDPKLIGMSAEVVKIVPIITPGRPVCGPKEFELKFQDGFVERLPGQGPVTSE